MLSRLFVQNYALIRQLDVNFNKGFSIITGETGAGKSILLGALSLMLGQRADTSVLKDRSGKCIVEGTFETSGYDLASFFAENDLDYDPVIFLRREISPSGKSRAFINDTPVTLGTLQTLGVKLVDIHSQHQNLDLANRLFQLKVLDIFAGHRELLKQYNEEFHLFSQLRQSLKDLKEKAAQSSANMDYFGYQLEQLEAARLVNGEQQELEDEREVLSHAEEIRLGLNGIAALMDEENVGILIRLKEMINTCNRLSVFYPPALKMHDRLESVYYELKDIDEETVSSAESSESDPERLEQINARLDLFFSLQQKHRVNSVEELIEIAADYKQKIKTVESYETEIEQKTQEIAAVEKKLGQLAAVIHSDREKAIPALEKEVVAILTQVGIPNAAFKVRMEPMATFQLHGRDSVNFLFSANKNSELQEISRVASGGEMSRVMLALKAVISSSNILPTIIFDEIDTGVSGEIARRMGFVLKKMSEGMQVINITHLPQIAGLGDFHYLVYKEDHGEDTVSGIRLLKPEERVNEIAKMLSGEELSVAALNNAKELLSR